MHKRRPAKITSPVTTLKDDYSRVMSLAAIVGVVGVGASFLLSGMSYQKFAHAYLTSFCFLLSISLGCLFFVTVQHLAKAGWSVTVRRVAEIFATCSFPMLILFLPILIPLVMFGNNGLYEWNQAGWSGNEGSPMEQLKAQFLNPGFFGIRIAVYFAAWGFMSWYFLSKSTSQDSSGDPKLTLKMQRNSTWMMIMFAGTIVFASFDLEMSLAPLWFSTMFPVYFFAGCMVGGLSTMILTCLLIQNSGRCTDEITVDHYHDLTKLLFSFVFFWGYISFSQFMLIWYANIPEETVWFDWRINNGGWAWISLLLLFGHLLIPFLGLMARTVRRNKTYLFYATIYMLCMHWLDHYWIVMPQLNADHSFTAMPHVQISCAIGMIGFFVAFFCFIARDRSLIPLKDPRLGEALNFQNH